MADSIGLARDSGNTVADWTHVQQSIADILTTPIGSRVMLREYGSELYALIDRKMTRRMVFALYGATAVAIARWEPRFKLSHVAIDSAGADGKITLRLHGTYYPRGHLGDYTIAEDGIVRVNLTGVA